MTKSRKPAETKTKAPIELAYAALSALPFLLVALPYVTFVPIWDGREYWECIQRAATSAPSLGTLCCAEHPTVVWAAWHAVFAMIAPTSPVPVALASIVLGAVAIAGFYFVAGRFAPGPDRRYEVLLVAGCVGLVPQVTASVLHPSPDFAVWAFSILVLAALIHERTRLVAAFGTGLVLSKESGFLVYVLLTAAWIVVFVTRADGTVKEKIGRLVKQWPLLIPLVLYALVALLRPTNPNAVTAVHTSDASVLRQFLSLSMLDNYWPAALTSVFVLSFAWIPTALLVAKAARRGLRWLFALPNAAPLRGDVFAIVALVLLGLALTRFRTYLNVRYFLPVSPLLILAAWRALGDDAKRRTLRLSVLGGFVALQLVSLFRTADPISAAIFDTFDFGDRRMLNMTSLTKECCGKGRDQLVYNLQFTKLGALSDEAYTELSATRLPIATHTMADWHLFTKEQPTITLRHVANQPQIPAEVWFIAYPNFPEDELKQWQRAYTSVETRRFEDGGYVLIAHHLRRLSQ